MSIIEAVLDGDRRHVRELPFEAGALLIFAGRQTLHRVTREPEPRWERVQRPIPRFAAS